VRLVGTLAVCFSLGVGAPAAAAPAADLVVVWAPGLRIAPVEAAAQQMGAAVVDRSPAPPDAVRTAQLVQQGIDAYEALRFDEAWQLLERARGEVDRTGAAGLVQAQLSDLFLYRGLVRVQQGEPAAAWDELLLASAIDPARDLDPLRFTPRVRDEFARAAQTVRARERARLTVQAPEGCAATVDAQPATGPVELVVGRHWVRVTCPDRQPHGVKLEVTAGDITLPVQPAPYQPPSDTELLVQARTAGARAFVVAEVRGSVATARLVGLDGRERDRRTVTIAGDLAPLAEAVTELLAPAAERRWYQSRWVVFGGGALVAAIVLVPVTALLVRDDAEQSWTGRLRFPGGDPWQR
jgi:hypothetical protein